MNYKALSRSHYSLGKYSIVPIRDEDRYDIMEWRNEQIYHLRQSKPLSKEDQDAYFDNIVSDLFDRKEPSQLLFSYLEGDTCLGYGGLVHINWIDLNAEVSFIMATNLETDHFELHWKQFVALLENVAFQGLGLHKIFTYAFDLRPRLYTAIESLGFIHEARLKEHCYFENKFIDVLIHSKIASELVLREANPSDIELTYRWAADSVVRKFALSRGEITFDNHKYWFLDKLEDENCIYLIAMSNSQAVGSVRMDITENGGALISYLIDPNFHGKGYGLKLLEKGVQWAISDSRINYIEGHVMDENVASIKIFERLSFEMKSSKDGLRVYQMDTI